ncbi:MAG: ankyrin repeat domain-containing protein [Syntrophales bacterium]|nr:ankyrin repeat domain-containing protein [Syntrophales bacterium]
MVAVLMATVGCTTKTPLIRAVENRDLAGVNRLLDGGANINEPSTGKWTASPLYWATYFCQADVAQLLLKRGASVNMPGPDGGTLLLAATACPDEMYPIVKLLIEKGDNINAQDRYYGYTPLINASYNNSPQMAKKLLASGADVNVRSKEGKTALDYARYYKNTDIISILNPGDETLQARGASGGETIPELQKAAAAGDAAAQYKLGLAYQSGDGVEKNAEEAARWFRMSAESKAGQADRPVMGNPPAERRREAATLAKVTPQPDDAAIIANKTETEAEPKEEADEKPVPKAKPKPARQNVPPSGYTLEYAPILSNLAKGEFTSAFTQADRVCKICQDAGGAKQNRYLALLERGKLALAAGKYDQCITDLQEAEKRFLTIEGTFSLTEGFGSLATDDTAQEYEPEMHEKLMISPYLVLAYLNKGDFDGARVERNRTIRKIQQYIEEKPERAYLENPFARLLSAIVYEMEGKYDDARIEYRKMKLDNEIKRLDEKKESPTDLVVLIDAGEGPQKYEVKWGPMTVPAGMQTVTLGFAYAGYNPSDSDVRNCSVSLNGKAAGEASVLYDLENTILAQYESNKDAVTGKIVARMTGKAAAQVAAQYAAEKLAGNIPFAGLFMKMAITVASNQWISAEKADLRSWLTLPKQIQYLRLNDLEPGDHTIIINHNGRSREQKVKLEKGKIKVVHFSAVM